MFKEEEKYTFEVTHLISSFTFKITVEIILVLFDA